MRAPTLDVLLIHWARSLPFVFDCVLIKIADSEVESFLKVGTQATPSCLKNRRVLISGSSGVVTILALWPQQHGNRHALLRGQRMSLLIRESWNSRWHADPGQVCCRTVVGLLIHSDLFFDFKIWFYDTLLERGSWKWREKMHGSRMEETSWASSVRHKRGHNEDTCIWCV
jgi:hypothetical protein